LKPTALATFLLASSASIALSQLGIGSASAATSPVAARFFGTSFSWANQGSATVAVAANARSLTITQPAHPNSTDQAALATPMLAGPACYTILYQSPNVGSLYNGGMFLQNAATGMVTIFQDIYANGAGSNLLVGTESNFQGGQLNILTPYGGRAAFLLDAQFFLRICTDGTYVSFGASPTGLANTFQPIYSTTLAALGNPDHVGFFEDADPQFGQTGAGVVTLNRWLVTPANTPQYAIGGGDLTNGYITTPNFPISDNAPVPAKTTIPSLPDGLGLASGAAYKAYYDFTPTGNVNIRAKLNAHVYFQDMVGNQDTIVGTDGIEGDTVSNWSQPRLYPAANQFNLLNFMPGGLNTGSVCSLNNTAAGCVPGHIYGTLIRFPTAIQLGDIVHVRMQGGNDPLWYQGFVLYAGVEKTPGPGGNPYEPALGPNPLLDPNCYGENDAFEGYRYSSAWPVGTTLKMGVVPVGSYGLNSNGQCWSVAPYVQYAANGPNFSYVPAGANPYTTKPVWQLLNTTTYSGMHDYVVELLNDGTHRIRYFFDGHLVATEYYEQSPTTPGWYLELTNQTVANFNPELGSAVAGVAPNAPVKGGSFSATYSLIEIIHGSVTTIAQPLDTNGASPNGDPIGLN
jgi:hypothetical protein